MTALSQVSSHVPLTWVASAMSEADRRAARSPTALDHAMPHDAVRLRFAIGAAIGLRGGLQRHRQPAAVVPPARAVEPPRATDGRRIHHARLARGLRGAQPRLRHRGPCRGPPPRPIAADHAARLPPLPRRRTRFVGHAPTRSSATSRTSPGHRPRPGRSCRPPSGKRSARGCSRMTWWASRPVGTRTTSCAASRDSCPMRHVDYRARSVAPPRPDDAWFVRIPSASTSRPPSASHGSRAARRRAAGAARARSRNESWSASTGSSRRRTSFAGSRPSRRSWSDTRRCEARPRSSPSWCPRERRFASTATTAARSRTRPTASTLDSPAPASRSCASSSRTTTPRRWPGSTIADVVLVNPLVDGMNLVAKEAAVVSRRDGVLVLSETAGAHDQMADGVIPVAPADVVGTADALREAIEMPEQERALRLGRLRARRRARGHHVVAAPPAERPGGDRRAPLTAALSARGEPAAPRRRRRTGSTTSAASGNRWRHLGAAETHGEDRGRDPTCRPQLGRGVEHVEVGRVVAGDDEAAEPMARRPPPAPPRPCRPRPRAAARRLSVPSRTSIRSRPRRRAPSGAVARGRAGSGARR